MKVIDVLKDDAHYSFKELKSALEGVTEAQAWAVLPNLGQDYLHSDGTIHGLVHHILGSKKVYGSISFRNSEYRWRDLYEETKAMEPNWEKALAFLDEAQEYWLNSWANLTDDELVEIVPTNWKTDRSALELIRIVNQHDSYHAGQIALIRYGAPESTTPPPNVADDILKYCGDSPYW